MEFSSTIEHNNICIIGIPGEEGKRGSENISEEIAAENFPNLGKETDIQILEAQRTPAKINKSRFILSIL